MKNNVLRTLVEVALFAALGFGLDALQAGLSRGLFINGGSIGLAMVPVFIISYRRGLFPGILCGLILSLVQMLEGIYLVTGSDFALAPFFQVLLDYVLGYTLVGFAGVFAKPYQNATSLKKKILYITLGVILGGMLKYASHVLSGGFFWLGSGDYSFLGVKNSSWLYSFVYNGCYSIPNIIISLIIMILLARFYPQFLTTKNLNETEKENNINEE